MKLAKLALGLCAFGAIFSFSAHALDASQVPEKKRTRLGLYLSATEAYAASQRERVLFIDARTRAEVSFLGMPTVADVNIPYMEMDEFHTWDDQKRTYKLEPNSDFVRAVDGQLTRKGLRRDAKIIVMCRSGDRSARAADLLADSGFSNVWTVVDGFEGDIAKDGPQAGRRAVNGWKNAQLPWSYELVKTKMALPE
jgi:rhodanese-related sulfurtransferase